MVKLWIDNQEVNVEKGTTILNAAASVGIKIPTLCFLKDLNEIGACRVCIVEIKGKDALVAACNTAVRGSGMEHGFSVDPRCKKMYQMYALCTGLQ